MVLNHITFSLRKSVLLSKLILQRLLTSLLAVLTMLLLLTSINLGRSRGRKFPENVVFGVWVETGCENICSISKTEIYGRSLIIHCIILDGWTFSQTANSRTVSNYITFSEDRKLNRWFAYLSTHKILMKVGKYQRNLVY